MVLQIIENFRKRLLPTPAPTVTKPKPVPLPQPAAGMKASAPGIQLPIKTFGLGTEPMDIYAALPISAQRVKEVQREAQLEKIKHEKDMAAVRTFDQGTKQEFNGVGLLDPNFVRGIQQWENEHKNLFRQFEVGPITSRSPIKTLSN